MPEGELNDPCVDCHDAESILTVRSRRLCKACFTRYVHIKVHRRMGNYRRRSEFGEHKLLLCFSFGLSSTALLHILNAHLERQRQGFAGQGYGLHVVTVDSSSISPPSSLPDEQIFHLVQKIFPMHSYSRIPLYSVLEYDPDIQETITSFTGVKFPDDAALSYKERLDLVRASISTATSKADVDNMLMNRLVTAYAKRIGCSGVIWGDSDSRLAAKTLTNVAKGRGSSVVWQVSDGMSPYGLDFSFPLRDLFSTELQQYVGLYPELGGIIRPNRPSSVNVPTRNLSIDELMMRYVQTHGEKYPGVMANVTRTASKLQPLSASSNTPSCALCGAIDESSGIYHGSDTLGSNLPHFCYACIRSRPDISG